MSTWIVEHGMVPLLVYIYIHRYEHEAILKPKTENNIGAPSAPQKLVGRRGAPELELLAVVIVLFAPILHEYLTNSNFAMLFINITVFKDVCKRVSFVG